MFSEAIQIATVAFGTVGMVAGFIGFLQFVSKRPTREEMAKAVESTRTTLREEFDARLDAIAADVRYVRERIDRAIQA